MSESGSKSIDIEAKLKGLPKNWVVLFSTNNNKYHEVTKGLIKHIAGEKAFGIYITINRPYNNIVSDLDSKKIKYDKVYFIDCITETAGGMPSKSDKVLYMSSPQSLTDLGVAIDEMLHLLKGKSDIFLILDSISMLLIYNNKSSVVEFVHFITSKMRLFNVNGALINVDEQNKEIIDSILQFTDKNVVIK